MAATAKSPERCETCGFSSRYTQQKPGEKLKYMACCHAWMCASCRAARKCTGRSDEPESADTKLHALRSAVPPNDGFYPRVPEAVYHADQGSLSSSGARKLVRPSTPEKFRAEQLDPPNPKPQYDFGHAAHKMVLGEGGQLVRVDADDWRTNVAKQQRIDAWAQGKAPLLKKDIELAQVMAGKVFAHQVAAKLLSAGTPEMSGYWHDDATGIRLRFRADWLTDPGDSGGRIFCVDYKSAASADPDEFRRSAAKYGYHQQAAWYQDGLREVGISDDAPFLFIVQEKTSPFSVSLVQLDQEDIDRGRRLNRIAIDLYAQCVETNTWPGYGNTIHQVSLPKWAVMQEEELLNAQ